MESLCKCGFYANKDLEGMCSLCYKKQIKDSIYKDLLKLADLKIECNDECEKPNPKPIEKKSRCQVCKRKIGLTPIVCRCGHMFCAHHRYPHEHKCSFDYKTEGRKLIEKENPKIQSNQFKENSCF